MNMLKKQNETEIINYNNNRHFQKVDYSNEYPEMGVKMLLTKELRFF